MANVSVFNMEGKEVGTIDLNDAVFGVQVNENLLHRAVVLQQSLFCSSSCPAFKGSFLLYSIEPDGDAVS